MGVNIEDVGRCSRGVEEGTDTFAFIVRGREKAAQSYEVLRAIFELEQSEILMHHRSLFHLTKVKTDVQASR